VPGQTWWAGEGDRSRVYINKCGARGGGCAVLEVKALDVWVLCRSKLSTRRFRGGAASWLRVKTL
jgi:hypothetical protein